MKKREVAKLRINKETLRMLEISEGSLKPVVGGYPSFVGSVCTSCMTTNAFSYCQTSCPQP